MNAFYFIYFISFSFSFFHFPFAIGPQQTTPPSSVIATAAGRFRFRLCVLVSLVYEDVLDHTILMEKKRGIWHNGVIYITILYGETMRRGATHMRAGQAGNGKTKWRKYHTPPPGEKIVSKDDYNYTAGVLVGLIGFSFCFYLFFFFCFVSFPYTLPFFVGQPGYVYSKELIDWILGRCSCAALGICLAVGGKTYIHLYACII